MSAAENKEVQAVNPRPLLAFLSATPIAVLGGLIGLGGAEFRLPVLAGLLQYPARQAVTLNLAVSLITVLASLAIRSQTMNSHSLVPLLPAIASLIFGAGITAFLGTALAGRLSNAQLERVILVVLVSSLLGVAGGELIIPTLVFMFGADVKTAGTASLLVSLPTVMIGIVRYSQRRDYSHRADITGTVVAMSVGSVIGALIGGLLVGVVPQSVLKVALGFILIVSAIRIFRNVRRDA